MSIVAFVFGLLLPAVPAWLLLSAIEGKHPVLHPVERGVWAILVGSPLLMIPLLLLSWTGMHAMTLTGFFAALVIVTMPLCLLTWKRSGLNAMRNGAHFHARGAISKNLMIVLVIAMTWTGLKVGVGFIDLISVPSYWDDSFNNWNLRGKAMYVTGEMDILGTAPELSVIGKEAVGSYPPTVPMTKTWFALLRGGWTEGVINSMHGAWFAMVIAAFFFFLLRLLPLSWSLFGIYALVSLPLFLIHGSNPYADVFVSGFVLTACAAIFMTARTEGTQQHTWSLLAAAMIGFLTLTKNEAMLLHAPILFLLLLDVIVVKRRAFKPVIVPALLSAVIALPWLAFKWAQGLSFGNAKEVTEFAIGFHTDAISAMWFFLTHEANFLILPFVLIFLLWAQWKHAHRLPITVLTFFVLAILLEQIIIYVFTPLATEAVFQTGIGRGLVQIAPVVMMLVILLGWEIRREKNNS